jgi:hypothetical protein
MAVREMSAPTVLLVALVGVLTGRYLDRESGKRMIARKRTGVKADGLSVHHTAARLGLAEHVVGGIGMHAGNFRCYGLGAASHPGGQSA